MTNDLLSFIWLWDIHCVSTGRIICLSKLRGIILPAMKYDSYVQYRFYILCFLNLVYEGCFSRPFYWGAMYPCIAIGHASHRNEVPPVDDAPRALVHVLSQTSVRGVLILPLWVRLSSFSILFPDGKHFIPQIRGWSLLSNTDFTRGPYGHATFLSPTRGGHKTPFIAVLINTAHDAPAELSDLPGRRFCLSAYYGQSSACNLCSH